MYIKLDNRLAKLVFSIKSPEIFANHKIFKQYEEIWSLGVYKGPADMYTFEIGDWNYYVKEKDFPGIETKLCKLFYD